MIAIETCDVMYPRQEPVFMFQNYFDGECLTVYTDYHILE